jgi:hypothetical protein
MREDVPVQWTTAGGDEAGFTVRMPGLVQVAHNTLPDPGGAITMAVWMVATPEGAMYTVTTTDYPETLAAGATAAAFLAEAREATMAQAGGAVADEMAVSLDGHPGVAYRVASGFGAAQARHYMVGRRLYTLLVLSGAEARADGADEFLRSLALVPTATPG